MKRLALPLAYFLGAGAYLAGIGLTISSGWLITMASFQPPVLTLSVAIVGVRFFGVSRSVLRYSERVVSHKAIFDQLSALRSNLFEALRHRSIAFARDLNDGQLVKKIVDDVERAQEFRLRVTLPQVSAWITLLVAVLVGYWIRPITLFFTLPAALILLLVIPTLIMKTCKKYARLLESSENQYSAQLSYTSQGLLEARLYGYLWINSGELSNQSLTLESLERSLLRQTRRISLLTHVTLGASLLGSAILAHQQSLDTKIPAVQIAMMIFLPLVAFESVTAWYPNLYASGKMLLAQEEINAITLHSQEQKATSVEITHPTSITLHNASVSWGQGFMKPVSARADRGNPLLITGRSGSGKSTLALGALGLLEYQGSISIGGIQVRDIDALDRYAIGSLQNSHIFNTSLRENLKIAGSDLTDNELLESLALVELDNLLINDGLDLVIGEFGRTLSGGEAKRLSVARALLSKAPIVILDEPTEHLDSALAERIEARILDEMAERTLIVISHKGWPAITNRVEITR